MVGTGSHLGDVESKEFSMSDVFAVFLSIKRGSAEDRRLFFANRLARHPEKLGVELITSAVMPATPGIVALLFVRASDAEAVAAAVGQVDEVYTYRIAQTTSFQEPKEGSTPTLCLFALEGSAIMGLSEPGSLGKTEVLLKAGFGKDSPAAAVWLVAGTNPLPAIAEMQAATGLGIASRAVMSASDFVAAQLPAAANSAPAAAHAAEEIAVLTETPSFSLLNAGTASCFGSSVGAAAYNYQSIETNKSQLQANSAYSVAGPLYLWKVLPGAFEINIVHTLFPIGYPTTPTDTLTTNYCPPTTMIPGIQGATFSVDFDKRDYATLITPVGELLDGILNQTTHDLPWPEDSYTGDDLKAYRYILSQIVGGGIPKDGNVAPGAINSLHYPPNADFSEDAFNAVQQHLGLEATYFQYASNWFGGAGLIAVMHNQISIAANDALTSANDLMSVSKDSLIEMVLEAIFGDIIKIVAAIPGVGPAISAVLQVGFSTAEVIIGQSGGGENAVKATVAKLAQQIEANLQVLADATERHHETIKSNWGKLQDFAAAVQGGKITPEMLDATMDESDPSAPGKPVLGQGYITAIGNAWEVSFFKALYYEVVTPKNWVTVYPTPEPTLSQTWNPAGGVYSYQFYVPCVYTDSSGHDHDAYLSCSCTPNATTEVLQRLFDPDQLGVDPISFFQGLDGWRYVMPVNVAVNRRRTLTPDRRAILTPLGMRGGGRPGSP
jgi:hypothetical protein